MSVISSGTGTIVFGQHSASVNGAPGCTGTGICNVNAQAAASGFIASFSVFRSDTTLIVAAPCYSLIISFIVNVNTASKCNWTMPLVEGSGIYDFQVVNMPTNFSFTPDIVGTTEINPTLTLPLVCNAPYYCSGPDMNGNYTVSIIILNCTWS